ncbi:MAG TPA: endonuclease domain-containing protein [Burkholderiales bacterium]
MRDRRLVPYRLGLKLPSRALRRPLGSYIADFYCSGLRLVIEIDGDSHFTGGGEAHDAKRTAALAALGLRVIRFTNAEVMHLFTGKT